MADDPASAETAGAAPAPEETTVAVDPSSSEGAAADDPKAAEPPAEPKKEKNPIKDGKVVISLNAVGDAPLLKQKKFKVGADKPFAHVVAHIRKQLQYSPTDALFVFCNSSFVPGLDDSIEDLAKVFHVGGNLTLFYATSVAWG